MRDHETRRPASDELRTAASKGRVVELVEATVVVPRHDAHDVACEHPGVD